MKNIKVSVIIPIYNSEKYLNRAIESIINQTLKDIEIILVDDCSTDNSLEICREYEMKHDNIKVIHKEKNEGLGMARNTGLKYTNSEFVAFIDSDDYIDLQMYEKLYENAKEYNADVVFAGMKIINPSGNERGRIITPFNENILKGEDVIRKVLYNMLYVKQQKNKCFMGMSVCKAIYKKRIFDDNNIKFVSEREFISEDYIFHLEFIPKCNIIGFDDTVFYYYCDNENQSLTRSYKPDKFKLNKSLRNKLIKCVKEIGIYDDVKKGIDDLFVGSIRGCIKQEERCKSKKEAIYNIKKIMDDEELQECLSTYKSNNIKQLLIDKCLRYHLKLISYYIVKIYRFFENR